jgi:pyruvate/2-oxoglutarate dehydrogenase complex dihydrolipoamide dehydrogenase (E3) component
VARHRLAQTEGAWVKVDPATLEVQPGVFGGGDVTGRGGFTHLAHCHGEVITRRLRGMDGEQSSDAGGRLTRVHHPADRCPRRAGCDQRRDYFDAGSGA